MIKQKRLRKTISLTPSQSVGLYELSEFDGLDSVEHAMRAIDEYLARQKPVQTSPTESKIRAKIEDKIPHASLKGAFWVSGIVNEYGFSALILKQPAKVAIDRGRISKLSIWDPIVLESKGSFIGACIVNYDRGWDIKPSLLAQPYYDKVKTLLLESADTLPKKTPKKK